MVVHEIGLGLKSSASNVAPTYPAIEDGSLSLVA